MVFDDDAKLVGLYSRYCDEPDELKSKIIEYIKSETFDKSTKNFTFGESELSEVSIPPTHY